MAAKAQFDLVLSGKSLEVTSVGKKGKYSMEVRVYLRLRKVGVFIPDIASTSYANTRSNRRPRSSQTIVVFVSCLRVRYLKLMYPLFLSSHHIIHSLDSFASAECPSHARSVPEGLRLVGRTELNILDLCT